MLTDMADKITWYEGDILDIPALETAIQAGCALGATDVIHAAAVVSFVPKDRDQMERVNVEGTANVVNVCLKAGVRKLGYVSSVAALGRPVTNKAKTGEPVIINETEKWQDSPNNSAYAKSKYRAELEVWRGMAEGLNAVMVSQYCARCGRLESQQPATFQVRVRRTTVLPGWAGQLRRCARRGRRAHPAHAVGWYR